MNITLAVCSPPLLARRYPALLFDAGQTKADTKQFVDVRPTWLPQEFGATDMDNAGHMVGKVFTLAGPRIATWSDETGVQNLSFWVDRSEE